MKRDRNCLMFLNYTKDYQYSHLSFVFVCLLTVLRESLYVSQNLTHTVNLPRNNRKKISTNQCTYAAKLSTCYWHGAISSSYIYHFVNSSNMPVQLILQCNNFLSCADRKLVILSFVRRKKVVALILFDCLVCKSCKICTIKD